MRSRGPVCARRRRVRRPACVAIGCVLGVEPRCCVRPRACVPPAVCLGGCRAPIGGAVCRCVCVGCVPRCGSPRPPSSECARGWLRWVFVSRLDVHPRVCVAGCARPGVHLWCVCVGVCVLCVCVCGLYVSEGVCLCVHVRFRRGWGSFLVGPGLCVGLGEGSLPLPGSMSAGGSSAVLGGDGHVFPFPVTGGGWAAGRWTDGGMRGRGMDRWA